MTENSSDIRKIIHKPAFSDGCATKEEHHKLGGDLVKEYPYQYLRYFLMDEKLQKIADEYE